MLRSQACGIFLRRAATSRRINLIGTNTMSRMYFPGNLRSFSLCVCIASLTTVLMVPVYAANDSPTQEIVAKVMKSHWDAAATPTKVKSVLTLNSVRFGKAYKATVQEVQVEGIPDKAMVTPAVVDFTVRNYYSNETQVVQRVREARVYKDKMDDWMVMTGSVKGQDVTTREPAKK